MHGIVNERARRLFSESMESGSRILLTGASGWFGRTSLELLRGTDATILGVASHSRSLTLASGGRIDVIAWDERVVADFEPTLVLDCAFLTRDKIEGGDLAEFTRVNRELTRRMLWAAGLESVRSVITISSGAAVYPTDALTRPFDENPYGFLKREAEEALKARAERRGISAVSARAWAVSGAFVQYPRTFALSDMILQAVDGRIAIRADLEVWRRYALVDELLAVAMASCRNGYTVVESGGPLVEMQELAEAVRDTINPAAQISRPAMSGAPPNSYVNDGRLWSTACERWGLTPATLAEQIEITARGVSYRLG